MRPWSRVGINVRLTGQDVQRGTFSQRHFVFTDQKTGQACMPFAELGPGALHVINSHLSEMAVVGFEYGVSVGEPTHTLPIWEAQFGDFFNGAQVIWDAFVSGGQTKWGLSSALTILLPHGYDGTGPEHSSCRLERFLQMTNAPYDARQPFEPNWRVVHPTTPANYFHLLRRQVHGGAKRCPLIVAAPKTLLRLPEAISPLADLTGSGATFNPLLDDPLVGRGQGGGRLGEIRTLVFCSGKFYYELERERAKRKETRSMALVRLEELCPLPVAELERCLRQYEGARRIVWCQEEHQNMGPYDYVAPRLSSLMAPDTSLEYVGRSVSAVPAAGYGQLHKRELAQIMDTLFSH